MGKMRKVPLTPEKPRVWGDSTEQKMRKVWKVWTRKPGKCGKCGSVALTWLASGDPQNIGTRRKKCDNHFDSEMGRIRFRRVRVEHPKLREFFGPHRVPGRELSEFLSAYYLCAKANTPSFSKNSPSLPQNSVRLSEFSSLKQYSRNSIPPVS